MRPHPPASWARHFDAQTPTPAPLAQFASKLAATAESLDSGAAMSGGDGWEPSAGGSGSGGEWR